MPARQLPERAATTQGHLPVTAFDTILPRNQIKINPICPFMV